MKQVVILTGSELRHSYFRLRLSNDERFKVVGSFCEGDEEGLETPIFSKNDLTVSNSCSVIGFECITLLRIYFT